MPLFDLKIFDKYGFFDNGDQYREGVIIIEKFREKLRLSIGLWDKDDYRRQWLDAATRILSGAKSCCFITDISDLSDSPYVAAWIFYNLNENSLAIQHQNIAWVERQGFESIYQLISERETKSEDSCDISEWALSMEDLSQFYERLKSKCRSGHAKCTRTKTLKS